jgi:hypothetical protein
MITRGAAPRIEPDSHAAPPRADRSATRSARTATYRSEAVASLPSSDVISRGPTT